MSMHNISLGSQTISQMWQHNMFIQGRSIGLYKCGVTDPVSPGHCTSRPYKQLCCHRFIKYKSWSSHLWYCLYCRVSLSTVSTYCFLEAGLYSGVIIVDICGFLDSIWNNAVADGVAMADTTVTNIDSLGMTSDDTSSVSNGVPKTPIVFVIDEHKVVKSKVHKANKTSRYGCIQSEINLVKRFQSIHELNSL